MPADVNDVNVGFWPTRIDLDTLLDTTIPLYFASTRTFPAMSASTENHDDGTRIVHVPTPLVLSGVPQVELAVNDVVVVLATRTIASPDLRMRVRPTSSRTW